MEKSMFFNSIIKDGRPDRVYKAEDFALYFGTFIGNGVFPKPSTGLQVLENDNMSVKVSKGYGWINGYMYYNTGNHVIKIDPADGVLNRIDRIVLRLDFSARDIHLDILKGEPATKATAKELTRNEDIYELGLADVAVNKGIIKIIQANITDTRLNTELCGIVHGIIDQVDTTSIFNQFQSWYSTTKTNYDKDIATWTKEKKGTFEKWYQENITIFTNQFKEWFKNTGIWERDFKDWLNEIKETLNGDIAGNLLNKINENSNKIDNLKIKVTTQYEETAKDIGNIKDLKTTNKNNLVESVNELFTDVDNGKSSLYSAIVDKKVTPRSKDFKDLTEAVTDIKLGQGNAQASEVLNGKTFTNDSGVMQTGIMPNMGSREVEPKTYVQELGKGYYDNIKVTGLTPQVLQNNFPNLKPENIAQGVTIGGIEGKVPKLIEKSETFTLKDMKKDFTVKIKLPNNFEQDEGNPTYYDNSIYKLYVYLDAKAISANYEFSNSVTFYHWGRGTNKRLIIDSSDKDTRFTNFGNGSYSLHFSSRNSLNVYDLTAYISFKLHKGYSIIGISLDNFPEKNERIAEAKLKYHIEYISNL